MRAAPTILPMSRLFALPLLVWLGAGASFAAAPDRPSDRVSDRPSDRSPDRFTGWPRERPWIDQVERDRDRSAGRILDSSSWELHQLRESRDVRLRRLTPRREFERLDEERDRQLQIDAARRRQGPVPEAAGGSVILSRPPLLDSSGAAPSPPALQAAEDERALAESKEKYDRALRSVSAAEARALRALRRRLTREGRPDAYDAERQPIEARHDELRAGHRRVYVQTRSRILGR